MNIYNKNKNAETEAPKKNKQNGQNANNNIIVRHRVLFSNVIMNMLLIALHQSVITLTIERLANERRRGPPSLTMCVRNAFFTFRFSYLAIYLRFSIPVLSPLILFN